METMNSVENMRDTANTETLVCENVTKKYGKKEALSGITLAFEKGKIYGLIGRNGAGKTTLLSILSAQNPLTTGTVTVNGMPVWENAEALSHLCFARELSVSGSRNYLAGLKVKYYLETASRLLPHWDNEMAQKLVKGFGLDEKKQLGKLSKGMLSMVTIIVAMASKADFTFLDEPVAGLDVVVRDQFYRMIIDENANTGRTFVISTHIIDEASPIFEEVVLIDKGRLLLKENTVELLDRAYTVSGMSEKVGEAVQGKTCYGKTVQGRRETVTVLAESAGDDGAAGAENSKGDGAIGATGRDVANGMASGSIGFQTDSELTVTKPTLQQLFVAMCGEEPLL